MPDKVIDSGLSINVETGEVTRTVEARGTTHGDYRDTARLAQGIKDVMHKSGHWERLSSTQMESLDLIATKIARVLAGDANYADHWVDIEGYAKKAREFLNG